MGARARTTTLLVGVVWLILTSSGPAVAADPSVVVGVGADGLSIEESDGSWTGEVTATNLTDATVRADVTGPSGCSATLVPADVPAARQVTLDVTLSGCTVEDGDELTLTFGTTRHTVELDVDDPDVAPTTRVVVAFGIALVAALLTMLVRGARRPRLGPAPAKRYPLSTTLDGITAGWSLDSWAGNLTVTGTALLALVGAADPLTALLGSEPEETVARLLVAGLAASLLVSAAPMVLKIVGKTEDVTILGLLLGGGLTLAGTLGLLLNVVWAAVDLDADTALRVGIAVLAGLAAVGVVAYGYRSLGHLLTPDVLSPAADPVAVEYVVAAAQALPRSTDMGHASRVHALAVSLAAAAEAQTVVVPPPPGVPADADARGGPPQPAPPVVVRRPRARERRTGVL
ncbi:hypothetical protein [Cellulomonas fimi]|uniref:hypothetical protein n=1 Tax=Cellulomonas fimi TaxID=1708 RepID=UPI0003134BB7|nr:hypothetical protein [Cellulomonas fimi]NNH08804.1 hypothetical protein [Cellulomonas fimi]VEH36580.1 Uncharacterised protein [Cellulomonas fimi]